MKGYFINRSTLGLTVLFIFWYYCNEQKDGAAVVFIAGGLSASILVTINFLFQAKEGRKDNTHISGVSKTPL